MTPPRVWSLIPGVSNQTKHDRAVEGIKTLVTDPGSIDWGAVWSSAIHEEEAKTNPSWAGGANVFSVASLFIPGIGVGAKAGTVANKAGSVAGKIVTATADSTRLGKLSPLFGGAAQGLSTTGAFLSKPGSFAVKVSNLVMPQTAAKVLDTLAAIKVKVAPGVALPDPAGGIPDAAKIAPAHVADDVAAAPPHVADDAVDAVPATVGDDVADAVDAHAEQEAADTPIDPDLTDESVLAEAATKVEILDTTDIAHYAPDGSATHTSDLVHPRADQGTYPNGAPKIKSDVWPDKELHPQGFLAPEARTPVVSNPDTSSTATAYPGETSLRLSVRISPTAHCRTSAWKNSDGGMDTISTKSSTRFLRGPDLPHRPSAKPEAPPSTTPTSKSTSCWTKVL
ncbi:hypothetical protein QFZ79_003185 [Arthrobacter sp. V4I6]|nr:MULTISPECIES: hypothetical protein [unclassified Arthrobacter]MDQ0820812.1 hypothetical protein [Arthrobacter sp. V1I7]MDQ0855074.1 hypothetical protein [Arthrobacter sp. V4I6]